MTEHTELECPEAMRWRFCRKHDRRFLAIPLLVILVCALYVGSGERTVRQVLPSVALLGFVVPVSVWLLKQAPRAVRRAVIITIMILWIVLAILIGIAIQDPAAFLKLLQAVGLR
jgi:uncharacterized membrane protein